MNVTPQQRGLELARQFEQMSPTAQRLLVDNSRWWPHDDGMSFRIEAGPDEWDALLEISRIFGDALDLDVDADNGDQPEPVGPGYSFAELRHRHRPPASSTG